MAVPIASKLALWVELIARGDIPPAYARDSKITTPYELVALNSDQGALG